MIPTLQQQRERFRKGVFGAAALLAAFLLIGGVSDAAAQNTQVQGVQSQSVDIGAVARRYPSGSITTAEQAERALAEAARERDAVQARHAQEEQRCNPKFFSSSCIEDANEARREALRSLRAVEVEANRVMRQAKVTSREEALAVKREKEGASREERDAAAREAASGAPIHGPSQTDGAAPPPTSRPLPSGKSRSVDRVAEHEEKMRLLREKEAAEADKRAKNIASYERKVQESEARQREVARRKEEKARKLEEKKQRAAEAAAK